MGIPQVLVGNFGVNNFRCSTMQNVNIYKYILCFFSSFFALPSFVFAAQFTFVALGDTQDTSVEGQKNINSLVEQVNKRQPAFAVHIGEFKGGSAACNNEYYQRILQTANRFEGPLVYLPGDNDWTDCFHSNFNPIERLSHLRKLLYPEAVSLGQSVMPLTRQSAQPKFKNFPENVWWQQNDVVFATFHNVGTNNNLYSNEQAVKEHLSRNAANLAWLDKVFEKASTAKALVIFTHANIKFDAFSWEPTGFDQFRAALSDHVQKFARPVLFVHGDSHQHRIDKPLKVKGKTVVNFTRLEVFGSPDLGVIYVDVNPETDNVFKFAPVYFTP